MRSPLTFPLPTPKPRKERAKAVVHGGKGVKIAREITICQSPRDLYKFCRNPQNLRQIIDTPVTIAAVSETEWHWEIREGTKLMAKWDTLIINDKPGSMIAWRSRESSGVPNAGSVRFKSGDKGTLVTVKVEYEPPQGRVMAWIGRVNKDAPANQVVECLRRLKDFLECPPLDKPQKETKIRERRNRSEL